MALHDFFPPILYQNFVTKMSKFETISQYSEIIEPVLWGEKNHTSEKKIKR